MVGRGQCVAAVDVKLVVVDVVQEHVDAAKVVSGDVDFLPKEAHTYVLLAQQLGKLQQQGTRTAGRVVHLAYLRLANGNDACQEVADFLRREELAARFPGIAGIHGHQELVSVAEHVYLVVGIVSLQVKAAYLVQNLAKRFVAFHHRCAQLVAVHVDVVKQPFQVVLALRAFGGRLDVGEHLLQCFVQVGIVLCILPYVAEQFRGQDEKAFFYHQLFPGTFRFFVRKVGIVKIIVPGGTLQVVDIIGDVLRNEAVEQHAKHILLEVPSVHAVAQVLRYSPYRLVQLLPLLVACCHCLSVFLVSRKN